MFDQDFKNPRTARRHGGVEREVVEDLAVFVNYNYAKATHITRFINRNDPCSARPWSTGLGADGTNGIVRHALRRSRSRPRPSASTTGSPSA